MPKPVPEPDELTSPYWGAAARDELAIQRCRRCRRWYPPSGAVARCTACGSCELEHERVSGRGTIYTYTVTHDARSPVFADLTPYAIVWVELDEQAGVRLVT